MRHLSGWICQETPRSPDEVIRLSSHYWSRKGQIYCCSFRNADGRKLKPYVVFKGVRAIPELNTTGVVVALSKNGWTNEELTKDWVKRV